MALSGSVETGAYDGRTVKLNWTATQNVADNTSTVSWTLVGAGSASGWVIVSELRVTANSEQKYYRNTSTRTECRIGTVLASGSFTVYHNNDGTGSLSITVEAGIYSWAINKSGTGSFTLDTIPRATTPTVSPSSVTMGSAVTISTPRAASAFTHTLLYSFGSASGTIATGVATSRSWTPPTSLAAQIPYATSGPCTITCQTYNGSTLIGTKTVTLTLEVPSSVVPTISQVSIAEATPGLAAQFGAYVQNKSTLAVAITAAGASGSTIQSYRTTIQGVTYTSASFTSQVLTASGSSTITVTVTDSRGRTATSTSSLTVLAYFPPKINSLSAARINTSGTADEEGPRISVTMDFAIAEVGTRNNRTFSLQYKRSTDPDSSFTTFSSGTASWTYSGTQAFTSSPEISTDYAYVIRLTLTDYFGSATKDVQVPTGFTLYDVRTTGKGIAFGKVSEKDALEVALPSEFTGAVKVYAPASDQADSGLLRFYRANGTLLAFLATSDGGNGLNLHQYQNGSWASVLKILPDGTLAPKGVSMVDYPTVVGSDANGWRWQKMASGQAELWYYGSYTIQQSILNNTGLYCTELITLSTPFKIANGVPVGTVNDYGLYIGNVGSSYANQNISFRLFRAGAAIPTSVSVSLMIHIFGTY